MARRMTFRKGFVSYPYYRVPYQSKKRYRNRFGRYDYRTGFHSPSLMQAAGMGHSHSEYLAGIYRARRELPRHVNNLINEYIGNT
jgi:hypothetical protein